MSEQKKDNDQLKEEFKRTLGNDKLKVENYSQMVDYIKNNKNIDIEFVVINTGEDIAKEKYVKKYNKISCNEEKLWADEITLFYIADKKKDENRIKQSNKLKNIIFNKKSDKPYGVMVLMVNNQGHLQHTLSFIIPTEKDNQKTKIIPIEPQNRKDSFSKEERDEFKILFAALLYNTSCHLANIRLGMTNIEDMTKLTDIAKYEVGNRIDFLHPEQYPVMKDATCFFYELMMLTKLLKNKGKEINKLMQADKEGKQIKFPLSIMKYTHIDDFIGYLKNNYQNNDENTPKQLDKVEQGTVKVYDNEWNEKTHNTLIYKKALKLKQQQQAQHINKFVKDNREIGEGDITADNLISYFKQEKDRSRRFFWVFGQRNKRFNALCETLEKLWKKNGNNNIRINENFLRNEDHMERDEKLIRDLFPEQQQGNKANRAVINNGNNLLNTQTIQTQIVNSLNQVGCCSCG